MLFEYRNFINKRLETIIVCVNYLDALEFTYLKNKEILTEILIITSFKDLKTQQFCLKNEIDHILTDAFYENGFVFDRGGAINQALQTLKFNDWVLHLDADIVLPRTFRSIIQNYKLDIEKLYGISRFDIKKEECEDYLNGIKKPKLPNNYWAWGYGFFQLFNYQKFIDCNGAIYPSNEDDTLSDHFFRLKFGTNNYMDKNSKWNYDSNYQECLPIIGFHIGKVELNDFNQKIYQNE